MRIDVRADLRPLQRAFIALGAKQVPFATSLALNALAKGVMGDERTLIDATFKSPTPFTENAYRIEVATKSKPIAIVAAKDIQAQYLAPYVIGGNRFLGTKKGMLAPRNIALNQYGNLPRNKVRSLQGRKDIFIGPVTFKKSGKTINGVWQRGQTKRGERYKGGGEYGTRGKHSIVEGARTTLKLLIRFEDTTPAPKHLPFQERAKAYLRKNAAREFDAAMRRALTTSR